MIFHKMPVPNPATRLALSLLTAWALLWAGFSPGAARADSRASVALSAAADILQSNGISQTILTATVRDADGNLVANGTAVQFSTNLGTLDGESVTTMAGTARVTLTSAPTDGTAIITATTVVSGRAASGTASVEFTSDHDLVSTTGDSRWVQIDCPQDLLYSADDKIIQAHGRSGSVHLHYRGIEVSSDTLQLNLAAPSLPIVAHNAKLTRGRHTVVAADLIFQLAEGTGSGIVAVPGRHPFRYVSIAGPALATAPMDQASIDTALHENQFHFADISTSHVIVSARSISVEPETELQFRRAGIYSDGKRIVSVPYHVQSLTSTALFGQQLVGFNSEGLMVNVPIYYHVTPNSLGTLYVRNAASSGANPADAIPGSLTSFTQSGSHNGVSVDLVHTYSFGQGRSGSFSVAGLTRSDWTAQWSHNQRINDATSSNVSMSYTDHRSSFMNYGLNHDFKTFSLNLSASRDQDNGFDGYGFSGSSIQATLNTPSRKLGHSGILETTNFSVARNNTQSTTPQFGTQAFAASTRSVNFNFTTAPFHPLGRLTTLTPSVRIGQSWNDHGQSAPTANGTLTLNRTKLANGTLSMGYFWTYDPLRSQSVSSYSDPLTSLYAASFQQRMTFSYFATLHQKLSVNLNGFYGLTVHSSNLSTGLQYHVDNNTALGVSAFSDRYGQLGYHETQFSLQRRVLGRLVLFDYSSKSKKVHFDLAAPGF